MRSDSLKNTRRTPTRPRRRRWSGLVIVVACVVLIVSIPVWVSHFQHLAAQQDQRTQTAPQSAAPSGAPVDVPPATPLPSHEDSPDAPAAAPPIVIPEAGKGATRTAHFTRPDPQRNGRAIRVRVDVENELPFDPEDIARQAADTLQDQRSWTGRGAGVHFDFVGDAPADFTIHLLTPASVDRNCLPLRTGGEVSCQNGQAIHLNAKRWAYAVPDYRGDIPLYRQYLVNHETGHFLGHGHVGCPAPGRPAPVMMQQTKGLQGCLANPWP